MARCPFPCFSYIRSLYSHNTEGFLSPILQRSKLSERLNNLPKVTQLLSRSQVWLHSSCLSAIPHRPEQSFRSALFKTFMCSQVSCRFFYKTDSDSRGLGQRLRCCISNCGFGGHIWSSKVFDQWLSTGDKCAPQGTSGNVWGHFWLSQLGVVMLLNFVGGGQGCC